MIKGTDLGLLTAEEFVTRRSETLSRNPNAQLDEEFEVESYLSKLDTQYRDGISALSLANTKPLPKSVREIVTIIAYHEGSRIRQTLDNYVGQDLGPNQFEIILLDNHPHHQDRDNTYIEVERFQKDNPDVSVIYAHKVWQKNELATVGNARKYVFDIALMRLKLRGDNVYDTILISNDADTVALDANYLSSIANEFDQNKVVDALVTLNVVPFRTIVKPNVYSVLTFWDALDNIVATGEPYNLIGSTCAYRASIYAAIGGYNPRGKMAGDLETGFLIADARNWNPQCVIQFTQTKHVQDPRRILEAVASRVPVNEMYYKFVSDPEIRSANNVALLDLISDDLDWDLLEEDLDSFRAGSTTGMYKWRGRRFDTDYKEATKRLGVQYEVVNNRIKLLNVDQLLLNYKNDFGTELSIIRSRPREHDQQKMDEMGRFFSTVSDSAIACRHNMAEEIAAKIRSHEQMGVERGLDALVEQYKRFAGHTYTDTSS